MKSYKFTIKGHEYEVDIQKIEGNIAEIEVNGTAYKVEIERAVQKETIPKLVRTSLPASKKDAKIKKASNGNVLKIAAPLPGNILQVLVSEGDTVTKGQKLLIMEAMKMENEVLNEKDGIVKSVKVKAGDTVLQGDILIEVE